MSGYYSSKQKSEDRRDYQRMMWSVAGGVFIGMSAFLIVWTLIA